MTDIDFPAAVIFLRGVDQRVLKLLLDFLYLGKVDLLAHEMEPFLKLAADMKIVGLSQLNADLFMPEIDSVEEEVNSQKCDSINDQTKLEPGQIIPTETESNSKDVEQYILNSCNYKSLHVFKSKETH